MNSPNITRFLFSLKSYVAAMLALFIAYSLDLDKPYWALVSAYIISQPLASAVRSKAFYRIYGSFLGAIAAIIIVPNFVNEPILLSLLLSLWISLCLYISVLDRTPRSYIFLLAGYTIGIIGFPSVESPNNIFNDSVSRFEEITIGILCASFIHGIFFPEKISIVINKDIEAWWQKVKKLTYEMFASGTKKEWVGDWQTLAAEITQIYILSTHLTFDTANPESTNIVLALDEHMACFLSALYVIDDRLSVLSDKEGLELKQLVLQRIKLLFEKSEALENKKLQDVDEKIKQLEPEIKANSSWYDILKLSLIVNINHLITLYKEGLRLRHNLFLFDNMSSNNILLKPFKRKIRPLYNDHKIAFLSALATFITTMSICFFWIATAWPDGSVAAQLAAIACCFFASQIDPVPFILLFMYVLIATTPVAAFYLFAVLPRVNGFMMLALVFAPFYLLAGFFATIQRWSVASMAALLSMSYLILLQNHYSGEFDTYMNVAIAFVVGMGGAAFFNYFFRSLGRDWHIRRLLSSIRYDLADLAAKNKPGDLTVFTLRTADKLGLMFPLTTHYANNRLILRGIRGISLGNDIFLLQKALLDMPAAEGKLIRRLLDYLAQHFYLYKLDKTPEANSQLSIMIDYALTKVTAMPTMTAKTDALLGLCSLRRNLFPDFPPYVPSLLL